MAMNPLHSSDQQRLMTFCYLLTMTSTISFTMFFISNLIFFRIFEYLHKVINQSLLKNWPKLSIEVRGLIQEKYYKNKIRNWSGTIPLDSKSLGLYVHYNV